MLPSLARGQVCTCTVVVCTQDRPAELERCLQSLRQICYPAFEVLVIDNASSNSMARALAQRYGARYVYDPVPGVNHARNVGVRVCDSEIVAFTDDDAVVSPEWLEELVAEFEDPGVGVVVGRTLPLKVETEAEQISAQIHRMGWGTMTRVVLDRETPGWFSSTVFGGLGTGGSMAFRRSVLDVWQGFDERLCRGTPMDGNGEHYAFFSIVSLGYKAVGTPRAIVRHPYPSTLEALRSRRLKDRAGLSAFYCLLLVEAKGHRLETLRFFFGKLLGWSERRERTRSAARLISPVRWFLAQLSGPWLYLLSTWRIRKTAGSSRALVPYLARALSQSQNARALGMHRANLRPSSGSSNA